MHDSRGVSGGGELLDEELELLGGVELLDDVELEELDGLVEELELLDCDELLLDELDMNYP